MMTDALANAALERRRDWEQRTCEQKDAAGIPLRDPSIQWTHYDVLAWWVAINLFHLCHDIDYTSCNV